MSPKDEMLIPSTSCAEPNRGWFALRVKLRHEKKVRWILHRMGFTSFTPLYSVRNKWADRYKLVELPLFPGYVFCQFSAGERAGILQTPGVIDVVRCGNTGCEQDSVRGLCFCWDTEERAVWRWTLAGDRNAVKLDRFEKIILASRNLLADASGFFTSGCSDSLSGATCVCDLIWHGPFQRSCAGTLQVC